MTTLNTTFLIIGGGIAGVSCAEAIAFLCPEEKIILVTESSLIKTVTNLVPLGKALVRFDVVEKESTNVNDHVTVITDCLKLLNSAEQFITTDNERKIFYKYLCLCTGARPKIIESDNCNEYIVGIRDTESVLEFQKRIKKASKLVILGNGGIASEIVYEIKDIEIDWVVKDQHITSTFVDPGAAKFFHDQLINKNNVSKSEPTVKRMRYEDGQTITTEGAALGPDWHRLLDMSGNNKDLPDSVKIHFGSEVKTLSLNTNKQCPLKVELNNGTIIDTDFLISATGVTPKINFECDKIFKIGPDQGIFIDCDMKTSLPNIYAAGDICYAGWEYAKHWFQMRLWTQARQMGMMAGKSMAAHFNKEVVYQDFCFELFGHVTKLFGHQVVLLGKYNGQELNNQYEMLLRITPDKEYIKLILADGKLQGAILIGETGLEETCENLILNQLDLSSYGDDLLNPNIDIEDYFD